MESVLVLLRSRELYPNSHLVHTFNIRKILHLEVTRDYLLKKKKKRHFIRPTAIILPKNTTGSFLTHIFCHWTHVEHHFQPQNICCAFVKLWLNVGGRGREVCIKVYMHFLKNASGSRHTKV